MRVILVSNEQLRAASNVEHNGLSIGTDCVRDVLSALDCRVEEEPQTLREKLEHLLDIRQAGPTAYFYQREIRAALTETKGDS
jgi:hypothetical protein